MRAPAAIDERSRLILDWREHFSVLPDEYFFEIIRMYLGEVQTPYNKTKLVEQLGAFVRNPENKKTMISFLDDEDLKIVAAVKYLKKVTLPKLSSFFSLSRSLSDFYEQFSNLEDRLVLYTFHDTTDNKDYVRINPLLSESLDEILSINILLNKNCFEQKFDSVPFMLNSSLIVGFVSYLLKNPELCKGDGVFKKKTVADLNEIFGEKAGCLSSLRKAFTNLNLLKSDEKKHTVDFLRLDDFLSLPEAVQYGYLCVASLSHFSRRTLQEQSQLLLNLLNSMGTDSYLKSDLLMMSSLIKENASDGEVRGGRFAQMLSRAELSGSYEVGSSSGGSGDSVTDSGMMDAFIDSAIEFGILYATGKNPEGKMLYGVSPLFQDAKQRQPYGENPKVLSVDAAFEVTLMPGLGARNLIELAKFANIKTFDTVVVFEISRQSAMRGFDLGITPDSLKEYLSEHSTWELPQSFSVSVEDWYSSYSQATLYKGYVLKVNSESAVYAQKNPVLSKYIREVLAPGIFLLSIQSDEEAADVISKSGLDFIGELRTAKVEEKGVSFPLLSMNGNTFVLNEQERSKEYIWSGKTQKEILSRMNKALEELSCTKDQREGLEDRIKRKIIVSPDQLRASSVRFEYLEATGMDYTGKIHVVETAITSNSMIEVELEGEDNMLVGLPLELNKKTVNGELKICLEPDHFVKTIYVSSALRIKKLRSHVGLKH